MERCTYYACPGLGQRWGMYRVANGSGSGWNYVVLDPDPFLNGRFQFRIWICLEPFAMDPDADPVLTPPSGFKQFWFQMGVHEEEGG